MTSLKGIPMKKSALAAGAAAVALVSVTACGSSASSPKAPAPAPSAPASSAAAAPMKPALNSPDQKKIAANWVEFFNPKAPQAKRLALLQHASSFGTALAAMSKNPQSATSTAKVDAVTVTGSTAKVTYDILVSGTPALTSQAGEAVKEGGTWKVSVKSFCALLAMQGGGKSKLPAACKPAS